jgi:hypothetical protein
MRKQQSRVLRIKRIMDKSHYKNLLLFLFCFIFGLSGSLIYYAFPQENAKAQAGKQVTKHSESTLAESIYSKCSQDNLRKQSCYYKEMYGLAVTEGYDNSIAVLELLQNKDDTLATCHGIGHRIGEGLYVHDKKNWQKVFNRAPAICGSGVHHGLIEGYLSELPKEKYSDPQTLRTVCQSYSPLSCFHTVGHLLLANAEGNPDKALTDCQVFIKPEQKSKCFRGVFMENVTPRILLEHGIIERSSMNPAKRMPEFLSLCERYADKKDVFFQCWGELSKAILAVNANDPLPSLEFCSQTADREAAQQCENRVVSELVTQQPLQIAALKNICSLKNSVQFRNMCMRQLVIVATEVLPTSKLSVVINHCAQSKDDAKPLCFWQIGKVLKGRVSDAEIKQVCKKIPAQYQDYCLGKKNGNSASASMAENEI